MAYNHAKRLKSLKGLTPYEYIVASWAKERERFIVNPNLFTVGINSTNSNFSAVSCALRL